MQGIKEFIPTETKIEYINKLLKIGFDTLDCGSFVSPKAIPQMADTALVLSKLELEDTDTKISVIVANKRGAIDACFFSEIDILGYPFSISETFQQRNTNASIEESLTRVESIQELCLKHDKKLLIYISMGFGNPYGDDWSPEYVSKWVEKLIDLDINMFAISDTIGVAKPETIKHIFTELIPAFPNAEIGAHFHTTPDTWEEKIDAAYKAGCTKFDGALKGFGGCPMAKDDLTGNMPMENIINYFKRENEISIEEDLLKEALLDANKIMA